MRVTPNYFTPEVVVESVRVRGYDHLVDSWSDRRHRVLYVRLCSSVAPTRLFMCKELHLSG